MYCYFFKIADLIFEFAAPKPVAFLPSMMPFQIEQGKKPDLLYKIEGDQSTFDAERAVSRGDFLILEEQERFIRIKYIPINEKPYSTFWCPSEQKNVYVLQVPEELLEREMLFDKLQIWSFIAPEVGLLAHQAFILHSSFVEWNGNGILFTAPSGTGKSTQADLWKQYEGADIYNGDRTVVRKISGVYHGFGSPYAGSSGIYRNESAPIRAIIVLSQGTENQIQCLNGKQAFLALFHETLMNTWDSAYMENMTDLLMDAATSIPIYHLTCRPDQGAVELVRKTLFGK